MYWAGWWHCWRLAVGGFIEFGGAAGAGGRRPPVHLAARKSGTRANAAGSTLPQLPQAIFPWENSGRHLIIRLKDDFEEIRRELKEVRSCVAALSAALQRFGLELKNHQLERALKDSELESRIFALSLKVHSPDPGH